MIPDSVFNSKEGNDLADQIKSGKSSSLDSVLNSPEANKIAQQVINKPENPARKTYKNILSTIFEKEFNVPKSLSNKMLSTMEKNPYGDATIQAGAENYLGLKRLVERPFSKEDSDKTANDLKDLENDFNERYADKGSVRGAKDVLKIVPYLFLPGGKARGIGMLAKTGSFLGESAGLGGLYGAASADPNESLSKGATTGAILNPAIGGIAHGISAIPGAFIKNPEKTLQNLETMKGQPIIGGEVLEKPKTAEFQTGVLANIPTSGQASHFKKIINGMQKDADSAWDSISDGLNPQDAEESLYSGAKENRKASTKEKTELYNKADDLFESSGGKLDLSAAPEGKKSANDMAQEIMNQYNEHIGEYASSTDPEFEKRIGEFIGKGTGSVKNAKIKAQEFDKLSHKEDNDFKAGAYQRMASAIRDSATQSAENSGSEEAKEAYKVANSYYANKFSKFNDPFVKKYLAKKGKTSKEFYNLARQGLQDPEKLQKILDVSGPDSAKKIATQYFSQALDKDGSMNFEKMAKLYGKLPDKVKKMLLSLEQRNMLDKLTTTHSFSNAALISNKNAPTGKLGAMVSVLQGLMAGAGAYGIAEGNHEGLWTTVALLSGAPMARRVILDNPKMLTRMAKAALKPTTERAQKYTRGNAALINVFNQALGD